MDRYELVRQQMMNLWGKTVDQLEHVSKALLDASGIEKLKVDLSTLSEEHDKQVRLLGAEVYQLLDQGVMKVPGPVQAIFNQARNVVRSMEEKNQASEERVTKIKISSTSTEETIEITDGKTAIPISC
jgi:hypothetical protein